MDVYPFEDETRRESRKRRRLSERRRVFSRIGLSNRLDVTRNRRKQELTCTETGEESAGTGTGIGRQQQQQGSLSSPEQSSWSSSAAPLDGAAASWSASSALLDSIRATKQKQQPQQSTWSPVRSDSPSLSTGESPPVKVSLKIQFHISVAPENEPLIVLDSLQQQQSSTTSQTGTDTGGCAHNDSFKTRSKLPERLSRHNSSSTKRRQQLLALHRQPALQQSSTTPQVPESGNTTERLPVMSSAASKAPARQQIYFKRDGQRFGQEFTLKLAVNRTYRCLLKVRPLLPLSAISVQGQQLPFADCTDLQPSLFAASTSDLSQNLAGSLQSLSCTSKGELLSNSTCPCSPTATNPSSGPARRARASSSSCATETSHRHHLHNYRPHIHNLRHHHHQHHQKFHQQQQYKLRQEQQSQMMRQFAHSSAASSNPHLVGGQLVYMFDWSASEFQVNKNKARTQLLTQLRFNNGQTLSLPMQVKFYQSECRQHLSWGSELHFIDYDCQIDSLGQIHLDRVHYY